jgi:regulator of sigma E protease
MSGLTTGVSDIPAQYVEDRRVIITSVLSESPAGLSGVRAGEEIISVSQGEKKLIPQTVEEVQRIVKESQGTVLSVLLRDGNTERELSVTPEKRADSDMYAIGISMDTVGNVSLPAHRAFMQGGRLTLGLFVGISSHIYNLLAGIVTGTADFSGVAGPVGIAGLVGEARELGFAYLMSFTAFISLNLAVLNLIPFPALDGGRIFFVLIEAVIRRPIKPVIANTLNVIGFGLLLLFMIFITVKDVMKLF